MSVPEVSLLSWVHSVPSPPPPPKQALEKEKPGSVQKKPGSDDCVISQMTGEMTQSGHKGSTSHSRAAAGSCGRLSGDFWVQSWTPHGSIRDAFPLLSPENRCFVLTYVVPGRVAASSLVCFSYTRREGRAEKEKESSPAQVHLFSFIG